MQERHHGAVTRGIRVGLVPGDLIENTLGRDHNAKYRNVNKPYSRSCYPTDNIFWDGSSRKSFEFCDELILVVHAFRDEGHGTIHALCVVDGKVGWLHIDNAYATVARCDDRQ